MCKPDEAKLSDLMDGTPAEDKSSMATAWHESERDCDLCPSAAVVFLQLIHLVAEYSHPEIALSLSAKEGLLRFHLDLM